MPVVTVATRRVLAQGRHEFSTQNTTANAGRISVILDRNTAPWTDTGAEVVRVTVWASPDNLTWRRVGGFGARGGVFTGAAGTALISKALIDPGGYIPQNWWVKAELEVLSSIDTRVDIDLDTTARPAQAPITNSVTYDSSVSAQGLAVSSLAVSITIAANSDRVLYMTGHAAAATAPTISSWTYGADTVTELSEDTLGNRTSGVARLIAPTADTRNCTVNFSASASEAMVTATSLYNVDQTTPNGTITYNTGTSGHPWAACPGDTDGMVIGVCWGNSSSGPTLTDQNGIPEYISVGTASQSAGATSINPTGAPAGRLLGDIEYCSVATENNETISVSGTGWAQRGSTVPEDTTWQEALFWRRYDGSNVDPDFSWSSSVGCSARRWIERDAKTSGDPHGGSNTNSGTGTTHSITGINATANNSLVQYLSHSEANTALGADAGYAEKFDAGSATGPYRLTVGTRDQATSGAGADNFSATGANASWVMRLDEIYCSEAGAQTSRTKQENISGAFGLSAGALSTEAGNTVANQIGWTISGTTTEWQAYAIPVKPAVAGATTRQYRLTTMGVS